MNSHLMIPLEGADPDEYGEILNAAINQVLQLIFERRELDLHQDQTYALYVLTNFQSKLQFDSPCIAPTTFPTSTSVN